MNEIYKKVALVAFQGDIMCFTHVLLNGIDMHEKKYDVKIIIEGASTKLIKDFHDDEQTPFRNLYLKVKELKLIDAVCRACATKMNSINEVEKEGLPIKGEMSGHPSLADYINQGYDIITF